MKVAESVWVSASSTKSAAYIQMFKESIFKTGKLCVESCIFFRKRASYLTPMSIEIHQLNRFYPSKSFCLVSQKLQQRNYSRPAFSWPRPKVTIEGGAYRLQTNWGALP